MQFFLSSLRAVVELMGLCLLGQGFLYLLTGSGREHNSIYRLFQLLTSPPRNLARTLLPLVVPDRAIPSLTFLLLLFLWLGLAWARNFV